MPDSEKHFLQDPLMGYPLTVDADLESRVRSAFQSFSVNVDLPAVEAVAGAVLEEDPGFHPAMVLAAQVDFLRGRDRQVIDRLQPIAGELPEYLASQLLLGRAAERLGEIPLAYATYRQLGVSSRLASQKIIELESRALEIVFKRFEDHLDRGRLDLAQQDAALLESWAPADLRTLEALRQVSLAEGDMQRELAVVRRLMEIEPQRRDLQERIAELEVEAGDIGAGLEQLQRLVDLYPEDTTLVERLERAKFMWRLELLPDLVKDLVKQGELDRADFATLVYWLVPSVRYSEVSNPPIATDILDHPRREEIVRVLNLGLMNVDETVHRFHPGAPTKRIMVLGALLKLLAQSERNFSCLAATEEIDLSLSRRLICQRSAQCQLLGDAADCLPGAVISGSEALDLFQRALSLLGRPVQGP